jgi:hypothetical protein
VGHIYHEIEIYDNLLAYNMISTSHYYNMISTIWSISIVHFTDLYVTTNWKTKQLLLLYYHYHYHHHHKYDYQYFIIEIFDLYDFEFHF